jgi:hypothetical protein
VTSSLFVKKERDGGFFFAEGFRVFLQSVFLGVNEIYLFFISERFLTRPAKIERKGVKRKNA